MQVKKTAYKLTRKQKAFADQLINNPKLSATKAVQMTYGKTGKEVNQNTSAVIATENLRKPNIQAYLGIHADKASNRVIQLIESEKEDIALRASIDVLDRTYGKAKQITEVTSQSISFNIDLSGKE